MTKNFISDPAKYSMLFHVLCNLAFHHVHSHSDLRRVIALDPLNSSHFNFRRLIDSYPKLGTAVLKFAIFRTEINDFIACYP